MRLVLLLQILLQILLPINNLALVGCGLDFGTSGCRIHVRETKSTVPSTDDPVLHTCSVAYRDDVRDDPSRWVDAMSTLISGCPLKPDVVSFSTTSNTLLLVDRVNFTPVCDSYGTPIVAMYDETAGDVMEKYGGFDEVGMKGDRIDVDGRLEELRRKAEEEFGEASSSMVVPFTNTGGVAKVMAMLKVLDRLGRRNNGNVMVVTQSAYVAYMLMGWDKPKCGEGNKRVDKRVVVDWNNLLKLGYDVEGGGRYNKYIESGIVEMLPMGEEVGGLLGTVDPSLSKFGAKWGGVKVRLGTTDSIAGFIGATHGVDGGVGVAVTSLGTTMAIKIVSEETIFDDRRGVYSHVLPGYIVGDEEKEIVYLAGGASQGGCRVLRDLGFEEEELMAWEEKEGRDVKRKDLYPLPIGVKGERFPFNDPEKVGNVDYELLDELGRMDLLTSVLYGISRNVELEGYKVLEMLGGPKPTKVVTTGGGGRNRVWGEMRRKNFKEWLGRKAIVVEVEMGGDEASMGAALIAIRADLKNGG